MKKILLTGFAILLLGLTLYQVKGTADYLSTKLRNKVWANRRLDAIQRSSDVAFGGDFYLYVDFLRKNIPEDASVLLPPHQGKRYFLYDRFLMQYFLFPRQILTCRDDCEALVNEPATFVISQDDFPAQYQPDGKELLPYADDLGVFIPTR